MKRILFVLLFLIEAISFAQELPPIQNYTPKEYGAENQNWVIAQSFGKYIYSGNNSGLLEFNGAEWKLYLSPNKTIIRSIEIIDDRIYTGAYMEFGYWERNDAGILQYTSLSKDLQEPLIEDEHFWEILKFDDWILFQSLNRIYIYDNVKKTFQIINSDTTLFRVFKTSNNIFYQKLNDGLYKIDHGKEVLVSNNVIIKNDNIVNIFEVEGEILVLTQESGFYFLRGGKLVEWNISASSSISKLSIYSGIILKNGNFILGTISNGIYQLNKTGDIIMNINQSKGLNNNTVLSVLEDVDQNLWLGLDNGISVVNMNSPIHVYRDIYGTLGSVYASRLFEGKLYLGTNQGLFYKNINSNEEFTFIEGTEGQVWCLEIFDNKLFCGHNIGTFIVEENKVELISNIQGTWDIEYVTSNRNLLVQGNYDGVYVLEKKAGKWRLRNKIEGFDNISSRHIYLSSKNELFVSHENRGVYKMIINKGFTGITSLINDKSAPKGLKSSLVAYNSNLLYASDKGIFKYNNDRSQFEKDSLLSLKFLEEGYSSGELIVDEASNSIWGFAEKSLIYYTPGRISENLKFNKIAYPKKIQKNVIGYENMTRLKDQKYLFGTSRGYMVLDLLKIQDKNFNIQINGIQKNTLQGDKQDISLIQDGDFKSTDNNFYINFSVPEYEEFSETSYQYRLKGMYEEWSEWSSNSSVSFENLPFGTFSFEVRAKIGNKFSENIAVYNFIINKPWYISNAMFVLYAVLFLISLILINGTYQRRFNKQKQKLLDEKQRELEVSKLESEKVIMKLKNEKLQQDIDSKTKDLSASTMSIIKKNELLNSIKKELGLVENQGDVKPVIKLINKNLVNNSDWEMFQEAFNNADSDFLKKIKLVHASLTPNDLRLCTYLRLNLSSKEIAPLLNISPRSVEIKRYRLRKKMELQHEKSLVEYILEV